MKKLPIRINPCDFVHLPLFTQLEADNVITIYDKNSIPAMYLFNKEGNDGFLLLSASKLEEPILAYSTESKLELSDMPRDLAVWIDLGVTKISQLNRKGFYYSMGVYDAWRTLGFDEPASDYVIANPDGGTIPIPTFTREDIGCPTYKINGPLLGDIMWGQGVGYNNEQDIATGCSNMPGGRYWAGCVMVAFGQIMRYHNDFGNFTTTHLNNGSVASRVMSPNDGVNVSKVLKAIYDITTGNKSRDCAGTAASIKRTAINISNPLYVDNQIFQYSSAIYYNAHNKSVAYHNIVENNLPIVLAGFSVDTKKINKNITINYKQNGLSYSTNLKLGVGHAWVCDGYQEELQKVKVTNNLTGTVMYVEELKRDFWHMNWGWHIMNGDFASGNGWYRDGLFNPKSGNNGNNLIDYDDIVGYDLNDDGIDDGAYHQGYYYDRAMVAYIIP